MKRILLKVLKWGLIALAACAAVCLVCDVIVLKASEGRLYNSVADVPHRHTALLLGIGRVSIWGGPNPYYYNRIDTMAALYHAGKVDRIIASGANPREDYNEPKAMREDLVKRGVPDSVIYADYAGRRTLDSVVRAKEIFGQDSVLVVSQQFHNERALYLARAHGIDAIGMNAGNWREGPLRYHMMVREALARTKAVLDVMLGKRPRFGGETVDVK